MSLKQPLYWRNDNFDIKCGDDSYEEISLNRKWERRIPEFFEELANLRLNIIILQNRNKIETRE